MTTTAQTISNSQIRSLRSEAAQAGDEVQVIICDIALNGRLDMDDYDMSISPAKIAGLRAMTQEEALVECADAISASEAMG